jgi:hypothetical protein
MLLLSSDFMARTPLREGRVARERLWNGEDALCPLLCGIQFAVFALFAPCTN